MKYLGWLLILIGSISSYYLVVEGILLGYGPTAFTNPNILSLIFDSLVTWIPLAVGIIFLRVSYIHNHHKKLQTQSNSLYKIGVYSIVFSLLIFVLSMFAGQLMGPALWSEVTLFAVLLILAGIVFATGFIFLILGWIKIEHDA